MAKKSRKGFIEGVSSGLVGLSNSISGGVSKATKVASKTAYKILSKRRRR